MTMDSKRPYLWLPVVWLAGLMFVGALAFLSYWRRVFDVEPLTVPLDIYPTDHPLQPLARDGWWYGD